jgi:hypothetical protein
MAARRSTPEAAQPQIRDDYRAYLDARLAFYTNLIPDRVKALEELAFRKNCRRRSGRNPLPRRRLARPRPWRVVGSLNAMIDITTTRLVALQTHPPVPIYVTLLLLALASSVIAGFGIGDTGKRWWLHTIVYATALTLTVYTIIDLEFPRAGIIRVDRYDQALVDLRNSMNE